MQNQLNAAGSTPESPVAIFKAEKEFLDMLTHRYDLENTETRLLAKFGHSVPS